MEAGVSTRLCDASAVGGGRLFARFARLVANHGLAVGLGGARLDRELAIHTFYHSADQHETRGHWANGRGADESRTGGKVGPAACNPVSAWHRCDTDFSLGFDAVKADFHRGAGMTRGVLFAGHEAFFGCKHRTVPLNIGKCLTFRFL